MDPGTTTLLTAGIVAFVGLATTWLNNHFTAKRELKQWDRQLEAERNKRRHEEKVIERNRRREMFQNTLTQLVNLSSLGRMGSRSELEVTERAEEAQKWLNLISLTYSVEDTDEIKFHATFQEFIDDPYHTAEEMRQEVRKLASSDRLLFPEQKSLKLLKQPHDVDSPD